MSAGPSVPAAILALYVDNKWAQGALWLTAALCVVLTAYRMWRREHDKVVALTEQINARPLEIVLRHSPSFQHLIMTYNKTTGDGLNGNYWRLAVHNNTPDKMIRNVSLCVTQCSANPTIHRPFQLYPEEQTADIPPQGYSFFRFLSHMKRPDGQTSPIFICDSESFEKGLAIDAKKFRVEVQAFSENAHARQWFDVSLTERDDIWILQEVGSWERAYEAKGIMISASTPTPEQLAEIAAKKAERK
jgi:hypothetical protein